MNEIIKEYALAHIAAEPNAELMVSNPDAKTVDECAERMKRVGKADKAILTISGDNLPKPLIDFLNANLDKGCNHCWISSRREKCHEECQVKIERWFECRKKLIEYGKNL